MKTAIFTAPDTRARKGPAHGYPCRPYGWHNKLAGQSVAVSQDYVKLNGDKWAQIYSSADRESDTETPIGVTGTIAWERDGRHVFVQWDLTGSITGDTLVAVWPVKLRPKQIIAGIEYQYGGGDKNPTYLSTNALRIPSQTGVTRRVGHASYMI
ncbi:hypothetical protein V5R04_15645 [Jonesiaceae bacterium BS-20]|uniref:Uncharacterized protein n=1 Tax=Jonesiaceae bacterium BS-20 TaxID=3120821 RepID=A0AAU7DUH1_9MICO